MPAESTLATVKSAGMVNRERTSSSAPHDSQSRVTGRGEPERGTVENGGVVFFIRSLDIGGAQRQLALVARGLRKRLRSVTVLTMYDDGAFADELSAAGVRLISLGKRGRWDNLGFMLRLARVLRAERPAVLHGYLSFANILAAMMRPLLPRTKIFWGLRASEIQLEHYDWLERILDRVQMLLSRIPDRIITNSFSGRDHAIAKGYPKERLVVVPNGIDVGRFSFDRVARARLRAEWGMEAACPLIGLVARLDPMKDHASMLRAFSIVLRSLPEARLVCVGDGPVGYATELRSLARALQIEERILWLGARSDMTSVYSALDIVVSSSSFGEGFSNAIAEAMACGRPCVVTEVGDSGIVVGDAGHTVPPGEPEALAQGIIAVQARLRAEGADAVGAAARARIVEHFGVERLVERTLETLIDAAPDLLPR